jgi:hypothetical protein
MLILSNQFPDSSSSVSIPQYFLPYRLNAYPCWRLRSTLDWFSPEPLVSTSIDIPFLFFLFPIFNIISESFKLLLLSFSFKGRSAGCCSCMVLRDGTLEEYGGSQGKAVGGGGKGAVQKK